MGDMQGFCTHCGASTVNASVPLCDKCIDARARSVGRRPPSDGLRDYGLGDPQSHGASIEGVPLARPMKQSGEFGGIVKCPNCGCEQIMEVTVRVKNPLLTTGKGTGIYLGCPACPWASPMVSRAGV